mmetsp:Transcript_61266/g.85217  ORF Transcript_61266/g.85217 Transcript_61266/m.85217 type:complete len:333 (-) Transcript_61266:35-1033(-)
MPKRKEDAKAGEGPVKKEDKAPAAAADETLNATQQGGVVAIKKTVQDVLSVMRENYKTLDDQLHLIKTSLPEVIKELKEYDGMGNVPDHVFRRAVKQFNSLLVMKYEITFNKLIMHDPNPLGPYRWVFTFTIDNRGRIRTCMDIAAMTTVFVNGKMKFARNVLSKMDNAPSTQTVSLNVLKGAETSCYVGMVMMKTSWTGSTRINDKQLELLRQFVEVIPAMETLIAARLEDDKASMEVAKKAVDAVLKGVGAYVPTYGTMVESAGKFVLESITKLMNKADMRVLIESFSRIGTKDNRLEGNPFMKTSKGPQVGKVTTRRETQECNFQLNRV